MKNYLRVLIFLIFIINYGCSRIELTDEQPAIPSSTFVDIDSDGNTDYVIEYFFANISSNINSDRGIIGYFLPEGENLLLHKQDKQILFLRDLGEIREKVDIPLFWNDSGYSESFISIQNRGEQWPIEWEPFHEREHNTYFLGLKLIDGNSTKIGWVELKIELETGIVSVLNKGIL